MQCFLITFMRKSGPCFAQKSRYQKLYDHDSFLKNSSITTHQLNNQILVAFLVKRSKIIEISLYSFFRPNSATLILFYKSIHSLLGVTPTLMRCALRKPPSKLCILHYEENHQFLAHCAKQKCLSRAPKLRLTLVVGILFCCLIISLVQQVT